MIEYLDSRVIIVILLSVTLIYYIIAELKETRKNKTLMDNHQRKLRKQYGDKLLDALMNNGDLSKLDNDDESEYSGTTNSAFLQLVGATAKNIPDSSKNPNLDVDKIEEQSRLRPIQKEGISLTKETDYEEEPVTFDELERRLTQYVPGNYTTDKDN